MLIYAEKYLFGNYTSRSVMAGKRSDYVERALGINTPARLMVNF